MSLVCSYAPITTITDYSTLFYCVSPYFWANMGIAMSITVSVLGAAWYIFNKLFSYN